MAKQDTGTKTYSGNRISSKQMKRFLATAKSPEERKAIKNFVLGEPLKFFSKEAQAELDAAGKIDELLTK